MSMSRLKSTVLPDAEVTSHRQLALGSDARVGLERQAVNSSDVEMTPDEPRAGAPQRQAEKSLKMREAILEAATTYIATHGYTRATLAVIAQEAGVSRGAITHHYPSKVDLAVAVIEHVFYKRVTLLLKRTKAL